MPLTNLTWQELLDHLFPPASGVLMKSIHACGNVSEKIRMCLQNDKTMETIRIWVRYRIDHNKYAKCNEKSILMRKEGNKVFAGPTPDKAADMYTKSIMLAHDNSTESLLAYGNLSAVLYHTCRYKDCISLIEKSMMLKSDMHVLKLLLRKIKANLNLGNFIEALKCHQEAEELHRDILNKNPEADLTKCSAEMADCKKALVQVPTNGVEEDEEIVKPDIIDNPDFPFASNLLLLKQNDEKGRFIVAKKKLAFGTVLFTEKPAAFVVLPQYRIYYCTHCCFEIKCIVPCSGCSAVAFCSESCRDNAQPYHKYECLGGVSVAYSTGIAHLALRMMLMKPLDPEGHARTSCLIHNFDKLPPEDVYSYALTGYALGYYLDQVGFGKVTELTEPLVLDIGRLITNGHSIEDIRSTNSPWGTRISLEVEDKIATAIYPSSSIMNHSCMYNIANCFYGPYIIVKASKEIEEGGEILNCYGVDCMRNARKERQAVLKSQYKFECTCDACTSEIDPNERFNAHKCLKCSGPVVRCKCMDCSNEQAPSKEMISDLEDASKKYTLGVDYLLKDNNVSIEVFEEVLALRKKHLYHLNKDIAYVYDKIAKCHSNFDNDDRAYQIVKEDSLPLIESWYGPNSIELANVMYNCINIFCNMIMTKYSEDSTSCDQEDSIRIVEVNKMIDQVEVLFDLYYGPWSERYRRLLSYKSFLVPLSQVWQYFAQQDNQNQAGPS